MAKLDVDVQEMREGEVTEIEFRGDKYVLTDDRPAVGDLILNHVPCIDQQANAFYQIGKIDDFVRVYDDRNELHGWDKNAQGHNFDVFKRAEPLEPSDFSVGDVVINPDGQIDQVVDNDLEGPIFSDIGIKLEHYQVTIPGAVQLVTRAEERLDCD